MLPICKAFVCLPFYKRSFHIPLQSSWGYAAFERQLIKQVALLPEEIVQSAVSRDPSRLNKYAVALAQQFHHFYNACRIKDAEPAVRDARLTLCLAAKQTIENVLKLIGVDAPESM